MGLVLQNIKSSFKAYRGIYTLLILAQLVAVIILFLVYGIIVSYDVAKEEQKMETLHIDAMFIEKVPTIELVEILPSILDEIGEGFDFVFTGARYKDTDIGLTFHEEYFDGKFNLSKTVFYEGKLKEGRYITEEEMNNGSRVMLGANVGEVGDTYIIGDEKYEIVGVLNGFFDEKEIFIPLSSCDEGFTTGHIGLIYKRYPTKSDYDTFVSVLKSHYGDNVEFSEFEPMNVDDIVVYNSIIALAFAIGVIAALDTILVYNYLMKKRKKQMAVFSIEGATRMQQVLINEIEVVIITVITAVLGVVIFRVAIENVLIEVYEISISIFSPKVYGIMLLAYVGCIIAGTLIITVINTRKKAIEIRRG